RRLPGGEPRHRLVRPVPRVAEGDHARERRRRGAARALVFHARTRARGGGARVGAPEPGGLERHPRRDERRAARAEPQGTGGEVERRRVAGGGDAGVEPAREAAGRDEAPARGEAYARRQGEGCLALQARRASAREEVATLS